MTVVKVPAGGLAWPWSLLPQHVSVPSVLMAQLWKAPAVTVVNVPVGGVACPKSLRPQQASETFVRSAQLWWVPALTVPPGGLAATTEAPSCGGAAAIVIGVHGEIVDDVATSVGTNTTNARDLDMTPAPREALLIAATVPSLQRSRHPPDWRICGRPSARPMSVLRTRRGRGPRCTSGAVEVRYRSPRRRDEVLADTRDEHGGDTFDGDAVGAW